jgi:hypothetical protein
MKNYNKIIIINRIRGFFIRFFFIKKSLFRTQMSMVKWAKRCSLLEMLYLDLACIHDMKVLEFGVNTFKINFHFFENIGPLVKFSGSLVLGHIERMRVFKRVKGYFLLCRN